MKLIVTNVHYKCTNRLGTLTGTYYNNSFSYNYNIA